MTTLSIVNYEWTNDTFYFNLILLHVFVTVFYSRKFFNAQLKLLQYTHLFNFNSLLLLKVTKCKHLKFVFKLICKFFCIYFDNHDFK